MEILKTLPGEAEYEAFLALPKHLYASESPRFLLGHDPVPTCMEGAYLVYKEGKPVGRFAFYENPDLSYNGKPVACIGSYECVEEKEVSDFLLHSAQQLGKAKGYTTLIGPMEGSTWNSYRFSTHNLHPNFFMEPYHHTYYTTQFVEAGFEVIGKYYSSIGLPQTFDEAALDAFERKHTDRGVKFRSLNLDRLEEDLYKIGVFSNEAFKSNFLFSPIAVMDFVEKYAKLRHYYDPDLVWLVEDAGGELQALVFAIKDHLNSDGENLIIKTLARKKHADYRGMGAYLMAKINQIATKLKYKYIIYAMVMETGYSEDVVAAHLVEDYKNYHLYGTEL